MGVLIIGLFVFLGAHSVRIFAQGWRDRQIAARGEKVWKALFSVVAIVGFVLIVWGYGLSREAPVVIWSPPDWTRHIAWLLTAIAFVLIAQSNGPPNPIRARLHHPMVLSVKVWAFAHLIANGTLADLLLFGSILIWAILDYASARRRDRANGVIYRTGPWKSSLIPGLVGLVIWVIFAYWLHGWLIGVNPMAT